MRFQLVHQKTLSHRRRSKRRGAIRIREKRNRGNLFSKKSTLTSNIKEYFLIAMLGLITLICIWWLLAKIIDVDAFSGKGDFVSLPGVNTHINGEPAVKQSTSKKDGDELLAEKKKTSKPAEKASAPRLLTRTEVAENLNFPAGLNDYPASVLFDTSEYKGMMDIDYTIDHRLQREISGWLNRYNSDYAAVAVIDIDTGEIQAISSHVSDGAPRHNLAVNAYYPGASIFKIVTASAALNDGLLSTSSVIPFNGSSTTLYKKQVFEHKNTEWTRKPTLTESFAKSINPVFGRIGANVLGYERMNEYARSFGFNRRFKTDIEISPSRLMIDKSEPWTLVEAGSGYTQDTLLSPLHGALLAATVANGGMLKLPYWVNTATGEKGKLWYEGKSADIEQILKPETSSSMRKLMQATVVSGTARKSFRDFKAKAEKNGIEIGGKTGTLRGRGPNNEIKGLHDWFVGYAMQGDKRIAFGILNVSEDKWKVKSHYVAKQLIDYYYFEMPGLIEKERLKKLEEEQKLEEEKAIENNNIANKEVTDKVVIKDINKNP